MSLINESLSFSCTDKYCYFILDTNPLTSLLALNRWQYNKATLICSANENHLDNMDCVNIKLPFTHEWIPITEI